MGLVAPTQTRIEIRTEAGLEADGKQLAMLKTTTMTVSSR